MWSLLEIFLLRLAMPAMNCSWHLPDTTVETGHASYGLFLAPANDTAVETGSASYGLFLALAKELRLAMPAGVG